MPITTQKPLFAIMGATGKIGSSTVRCLLERGARVGALVRDASRADALRNAGCEIAEVSLGHPRDLTHAFAGVSGEQVICPMSTQALGVVGCRTANVANRARCPRPPFLRR